MQQEEGGLLIIDHKWVSRKIEAEGEMHSSTARTYLEAVCLLDGHSRYKKIVQLTLLPVGAM